VLALDVGDDVDGDDFATGLRPGTVDGNIFAITVNPVVFAAGTIGPRRLLAAVTATGGSYPKIERAAADVLRPYLESEAKPPRRVGSGSGRIRLTAISSRLERQNYPARPRRRVEMARQRRRAIPILTSHFSMEA
jgi:hypothetical protein